MARIIVLDAGPLGLASKPPGKPDADRCRAWVRALDASGARIVVPEIADYEVRRKLLHIGAKAGVRRLDQLKTGLEYCPLTTDAMQRAAELRASVRSAGQPTAPPEALDGDCILAAQALLSAGAGDVVTVATDNVGHLGRMVDAGVWESLS